MKTAKITNMRLFSEDFLKNFEEHLKKKFFDLQHTRKLQLFR